MYVVVCNHQSHIFGHNCLGLGMGIGCAGIGCVGVAVVCLVASFSLCNLYLEYVGRWFLLVSLPVCCQCQHLVYVVGSLLLDLLIFHFDVDYFCLC